MSFASVYPHYIAKAEKKDVQKLRLIKLFIGSPATMKKRYSKSSTIKQISRISLIKLQK